MKKDKIRLLQDRARMLSLARSFFKKRRILEVDCPILSKGASIDAHIDLIPALYAGSHTRYLHSSPEYGMKRLLSEGMGDIYQLSHVFRDGEYGQKHNPEFMMAEWYRLHFSFKQIIDETTDFIRIFLGSLPSSILTYREAFQKYSGFNYLEMSCEDLFHHLTKISSLDYTAWRNETKDNLLNIILSLQIEPQLGNNELTALIHYPSTQAALAKTVYSGKELVAERFEIYYKGIELANGYHELSDAKEQRSRFHTANEERKDLGKSPLPLDEFFLEALEKGFPNCCGVAVGFDRLMMLRHGSQKLADVIPFSWESI